MRHSAQLAPGDVAWCDNILNTAPSCRWKEKTKRKNKKKTKTLLYKINFFGRIQPLQSFFSLKKLLERLGLTEEPSPFCHHHHPSAPVIRVVPLCPPFKCRLMPYSQEGHSIYLEPLEMLINYLSFPRTILCPLICFFLPPSLLVILTAFILPFHSSLPATHEGLL